MHIDPNEFKRVSKVLGSGFWNRRGSVQHALVLRNSLSEIRCWKGRMRIPFPFGLQDRHGMEAMPRQHCA
jgi:hypothetical protein